MSPPTTNPYRADAPHDDTTRHSSLQTAPLPAEIISHWVWLYCRFSLSYRAVQEMMAERGVIVSHEAVRYWGRKFGQAYANSCGASVPDPVTRGTWTRRF
jgi:putative transposase